MPDPLENLLPGHRVDEYRAKGVICEPHGEGTPFLFWLVSGSAASFRTEAGQGRTLIDYLPPGELFTDYEVPVSRIPAAGVRARGGCRVARLPWREFLERCQQAPQLFERYAADCARRLERTEEKAHSLVTEDVSARLLEALHRLAELPGTQPHAAGTLIRVTRRELGQYAGCSREVAGRVLKALQAEGRVQLEGQSVVLCPEGDGRANSPTGS